MAPRVEIVYTALALLLAAVAQAQEFPGAVAEEFPVTAAGRVITVRVLSPPAAKLAAEPALLLTFAMDRATSLTKHPYCFAAEYFLAQGHRAASFDLPNHGDRVNAHGQQIEGMRNAFAAGDDPFAAFVADGRAVIDACIARGIAKPGRIAVAGTSRGGYMALRLLSGDERIAAAAAFAPVTDWRELREFAADRENADVANLQLVHFVPGMIGKQVFIAIGKTDTRVSTQHCQEFADALIAANAKAARAPALVEFHLTDDPGHSCADEWYERGRAALLQATLSGPPAP